MTSSMTAAQALAWLAEKPGRVVEGFAGHKFMFKADDSGNMKLCIWKPETPSYLAHAMRLPLATYTPVPDEPEQPKRYPVTPETLGQFERVVIEEASWALGETDTHGEIISRDCYWLTRNIDKVIRANACGWPCYSTEPPNTKEAS